MKWKIGPIHWHKGSAGRDCRQTIYGEDHRPVCVVFGAQFQRYDETGNLIEDPRNSEYAQLIASAPEMAKENFSLRVALAAKDAELKVEAEARRLLAEERQGFKQQLAAKDAEIERLRKALGECLDEFAHRAFDSPQASHRGNAEMMKVCGSALGEAGKKEPEMCVWTVNVTENSWILGCDESKDTSTPPKVCPYCGKCVEVRG